MKQRSFKFICLIVWACITVFSGYGDNTTTSFETIVLESFNGDADAPYVWRTEASRFITSTNDVSYPLLTFVEAWPIAVFGQNRGDNATPLRSLGLNGRFNRQGYNWIDLYPVLADDPDESPFEIPIPGRVQNMDVWVWGSNLRYYIEVFVRDHTGVVHTLRLGDISYTGWRNLRVNVPTNIRQTRRVLPSHAGLYFVKFRIWTQPVERVDNFFIYFKQLKVLTDTFNSFFDGSDLADPQNVERLWAN
jgi:hypothetical protein